MMVAEGVAHATASVRGTVESIQAGTITVGLYGTARYEPEPNDRLRIEFGGVTQEFVIHEWSGDKTARNSVAWLAAPHRLRYSHHVDLRTDLSVLVVVDAESMQMNIDGWVVRSGRRYDVKLRANGTFGVKPGVDGHVAIARYDLAGSLKSGEFDLRVDESHESELPAERSFRLMHNRMGGPTPLRATLNSVVYTGSDEYRFRNVKVITDLPGRASETGLIEVAGEVLFANQPFGKCAAREGQVVIETASGELELATSAR